MAIIPCGIVVREPVTAVALLAWAYREQKADVMSGRDLHDSDPERAVPAGRGAPWPRDCCAALAQTATLGARIRGTGHRQRPALHPDAEAVHDMVVLLSRSDPVGAHLLRDYARLGEIPETCGPPPRPEPVYRRTGNNRLKVVEECAGPAPYCPLRYHPSLDSEAEARAEYRAWWTALARLAASLPSLRRWRLTGLGAAEPAPGWERQASARNPLSGIAAEFYATNEKGA